jgi:effector-binding domain-containing protein
MDYLCEIKDQPSQPTLSVRARAAVQDLPVVFGKAFGSIGQLLSEIGEEPAGMPFAAYFNMDMQNLDLEIGFPVKKKLPGKGEIQASEIPAGKYASTMYVGPYDKIQPAYEALLAYAKEKGFEYANIAYEFYYDGPEVPPEKTRTMIVFPVK